MRSLKKYLSVNKKNAIAIALFLLIVLPVIITTISKPQNLSSHAAATSASFTVFLHGIGKAGDSTSVTALGNTSPKTIQRNLTVNVYNAQNALVSTKVIPVTYNSVSGAYTGDADFSNLTSGAYTISVKSDQTLQKIAPGIQQLTSGTTNNVAPIYLVSGDINGDNLINIIDYNILMGCYSDLKPAVNCDPSKKTSADLTDDGKVNQFDYNLFLRETSNRNGDSDPIASSPTTAPAPTATPAVVPPTGGTNLTAYGAKCNGQTDDTGAFQAGIAAMQKGGTLLIPAGNCLINGGNIALGNNVTFRGSGDNSVLTFKAANAVMVVNGSNTTFSYLKIVHLGNTGGVLFWFSSPSMTNFTVDHATLDGRMDIKGNGNYFHGLWFAPAGVYKNIKIQNSTLTNFDFAFGINSSFPGTLNGLTVDSSTFIHNYGDDVEVNAPSTNNVGNVTVTNNTFRDNQYANIALVKGIGTGFANVHGGLVKNNTYSGYYAQPLHIEDRSSNFTIEGNKFSNAAKVPLGHAAYIYILSNAHDIVATNNYIDASANTNAVWCFYGSPGGPSPPLIDPYNLTGNGNTCKRGAHGQLSIGQWKLTNTIVQ